VSGRPRRVAAGGHRGGPQGRGCRRPRALARMHHPVVAAVLAPLIEAGVVATCGVIEFELGWATRTNLPHVRTFASHSSHPVT